MNFPSLDHVGIAVEDARKAAALFEVLLDRRPYEHEDVAAEGVRTHFISAGTAKLELVEALGSDSPVTRFLQKRGEGIHHIAFEVGDIQSAFNRLKQSGFSLLSEAPKPGADDKLIFFLHPKDTGGVLIEFCQSVAPLLEPNMVSTAHGDVAAYSKGDRKQQPLVALHGIGGSTALETARFAKRMAEHFFVVALDFAGHGASSDPLDAELTFDLFTENVIAAMDHFEIDRAHLFGFSMGGAAALKTAHVHPDRIRQLAAHATYVFWDEDQARTMVRRLDPDEIEQENQAAAERLAEAHGATWKERFRSMQTFARHLPELAPTAGELADLTAPVMISTCDRDPFFDMESSMRLQKGLPDARLIVLPGERHAFHAVDTNVLARLLCDFFRG